MEQEGGCKGRWLSQTAGKQFSLNYNQEAVKPLKERYDESYILNFHCPA